MKILKIRLKLFNKNLKKTYVHKILMHFGIENNTLSYSHMKTTLKKEIFQQKLGLYKWIKHTSIIAKKRFKYI